MRPGVKAAAIFSMLLITVLVMAPALKGDFFFDDIPNIVDNTAIHITQLTLNSLKQIMGGALAGALGRPVSVLSFALTYYFFGLDAFAFKTINLGIHLINGLLIYWIILFLFHWLRTDKLPDKAAVWMALCVTSLWLIHPINIMPVMLAVQRMTLLSGMFVLLAIICHLKAISVSDHNRYKYLWLAAGWLICWPLAVLSKENGILFPLYILLLMLLMETARQRTINKPIWTMVLSINGLLGVAAVLLLLFEWRVVAAGYAMRPFSIGERVMTESRVLWFYLSQITLPNYFAFGVYLDDIPLSHNLLEPPATLIAVLGWIVTIMLLIKYWHRYPFICFGVSWFLVGHLLESTFLALEIAHEHRNYIPSLGIIAGVVWLGFIGIQKIKGDGKKLVVFVLPIAVILLLSLITWLRANQLGDSVIGPQLEAQRHPQSARANYTAAAALFKAGRGHATEEPAIGQIIKLDFERANAADPTFKLGYIGLIVWACASNISVESQWVDELANRLKKAPFGPADINLPNSIGEPILAMPTCLNRQQVTKVLQSGAENPTATQKGKAKFWEWLADYELIVTKDVASAKSCLEKALYQTPNDVMLRNKLDALNKMSI